MIEDISNGVKAISGVRCGGTGLISKAGWITGVGGGISTEGNGMANA